MVEFINPPFEYVSGITGASVDEIKLIFSFVLSYPLAGIVKRLPDNRPYEKNIFIICCSLFYIVGLFNLWTGLRTLFIDGAGCYAIAYYIKGPWMPWIGFVFQMVHMSINHIHRHIINDPHLVDITGAQMVLVMKLTAFCWNVHDGRLPEKLLDKFQNDHAIRHLPGFLDYVAYVLFFPSLFAGPAFDYVEYRRWIETTMFELPPDMDPALKPPTRKRRRIPRSGLPATIKCVTGLLWIVVFLQASGYYYPEYMLEGEYMQFGFLRRIWILYATCFVQRTKYYGVWALTEGSCILTGIGYNGVNPKTGKIDWDRLRNVNPLGIELAQNSRAYLGNWNMNTNIWLRNYMYLRVTPRGKKPGFRASLATFMTSAFWHGFEPGYYLTFALGAFLQTVAKNCRRFLRPFFLTPDGKTPTSKKPIYDIASWIITQAFFSFTVAPFILLTLPASLTVWSRVYYYAVVGTAAATAFFSSPGRSFLSARLEARNEAKLEREDSHDSLSGPNLGLPDDPAADVDEIVEEVKQELYMRKQRGQSFSEGLGEAVQSRLGKLKMKKKET